MSVAVIGRAETAAGMARAAAASSRVALVMEARCNVGGSERK
jgi:hypothetical protein